MGIHGLGLGLVEVLEQDLMCKKCQRFEFYMRNLVVYPLVVTGVLLVFISSIFGLMTFIVGNPNIGIEPREFIQVSQYCRHYTSK
jgi:hypothetical protein